MQSPAIVVPQADASASSLSQSTSRATVACRPFSAALPVHGDYQAPHPSDAHAPVHGQGGGQSECCSEPDSGSRTRSVTPDSRRHLTAPAGSARVAHVLPARPVPAGFDTRLAASFDDLGAPASPVDEAASDGADCSKRDHGPFDCDICGRVFSSKHNLRSHREVVHFNIRRFSCSVCSKSFARADRLARHCRTQHNLEVRVTRRVEPASAGSASRNSPYMEKVDDVTAAMVKASHLGDSGSDLTSATPASARSDAGRVPPAQHSSVGCQICGCVFHSLEQALEHTFSAHVNMATLVHPAPTPAQAAAAVAASPSAGRFLAHQQQQQAYAAAAAADTPPASASAGLGVTSKLSTGVASHAGAMGARLARPLLDPVPHAGVQSYPMALHAQQAGNAIRFSAGTRPAPHQLGPAPHMPLRHGRPMVHGPASFLPPGFDDSRFHQQAQQQHYQQHYLQQQRQQHATHPAFIAAASVPVSSGYQPVRPLA